MRVIDGTAHPLGSVVPQRTSSELTTDDLRIVLERLPGLTGESVDDGERIDQLALLESIKGAAAAAQARVSVAFDASQREAQAVAGVPAR